MAERLVSFKREMRDAIRDGRKTQTRRVVTPQPTFRHLPPKIACLVVDDRTGHRYYAEDYGDDRYGAPFKCPYGNRGDILLVREPWAVAAGYDHLKPSELRSKAYLQTTYLDDNVTINHTNDVVWPIGRARSPLFMTKLAARLRLEIIDVRAQQVQDISEEDAIAEGVERHPNEHLSKFTGCPAWTDYQIKSPLAATMNARGSFRTLWDSINAKRGFGWDSNPWVFAYTFKVLEGRA